MTDIPANKVTKEDLAQWYKMSEELRKLRASEMTLRKKIFESLFEDPKEGTNSYELEEGYVLKAVQNYSREIDPGAFNAILPKLRELGVNIDSLVQYKPSLLTRGYRSLSGEALKVFDQCIVTKPQSPSLSIVLPKKNAK